LHAGRGWRGDVGRDPAQDVERIDLADINAREGFSLMPRLGLGGLGLGVVCRFPFSLSVIF
jgi:hypothetical protein